MKILIVDDNNTNLRLLTGMVQKLRDCSPISLLFPRRCAGGHAGSGIRRAILDYMIAGL